MTLDKKTHINKHGGVTGAQIVKNGGVVEESKIRHVLGLLEFRRVHLLHLVGLEDLLKMGIL